MYLNIFQIVYLYLNVFKVIYQLTMEKNIFLDSHLIHHLPREENGFERAWSKNDESAQEQQCHGDEEQNGIHQEQAPGTYFPYIPLDVTIPHKLLHLVEDRGYVLRKNILHNLLPGEK